MIEARRVIIFDDYQEDDGSFPARDAAAQAVQETDFAPVVFEAARPALELLDEANDIEAIVTSLGREMGEGYESNYPGLLLIRSATKNLKPVALLSNHPNAPKYIRSNPNSIVIPIRPYEQIAPSLHKWFMRLIPEPSMTY
jgi:hypothetical protein